MFYKIKKEYFKNECNITKFSTINDESKNENDGKQCDLLYNESSRRNGIFERNIRRDLISIDKRLYIKRKFFKNEERQNSNFILIKRKYFKNENILPKKEIKEVLEIIEQVIPEKKECNVKLCSYNFIKGKRIGKMCDNKAHGDSDYCKIHQNKKQKISNKLFLKRHNKLNILYDPITNLVFESDTNKMVIGLLEKDKITSNYDINFCKKNGYRFKEKERPSAINFLESLISEPINYVNKIDERDLFNYMVSCI